MKKLITIDTNLNICEVLEHTNDNYGYIISTNVGTSFNEIFTLTSEITGDQIFVEEKRILVKIFKNLKEAIDTFITNLNNNGYILGNINLDNITLGQDNKIYFINYSTMFNLNDKEKIKENVYSEYGKTEYYQKILKYYFEFEQHVKDEKKEITISYLIDFIIKRSKTPPITSIIISEVIEAIIPKEYLKNKDKECSLDEIYINCFLPIIKKIDIYALCRSIFKLYYKFITTSRQTNLTYRELVQLIGFDSYTTINSHVDLSQMLNNVIETLKV